MLSFKIKICGITNVNDARLAAKAGADAIGLNFYERSLRSLKAADALEIIVAVPDDLAVIGVFVNHPVDEILELAEHLQFTAVQLHGDEKPEIVGQLGSQSIIRAVRIGGDSESAIKIARREIDEWSDAGASGILLDTASGKVYGGTGESINWEVVQRLDIPCWTILAGGLTPANVAEAIKTANPDAVDVASGAEKFPGGKDPELLGSFVTRALNAFDDS